MSDGLDEREFDTIAHRFGFDFGADHRAMLVAGLPMGEGWVDWRGSVAALNARLEEPINGILAHIEPPDGFWMPMWGAQPNSLAGARRIAETHVRRWSRLVPIYSHRYTAAAPSPSGASVLSISGTDVIYYGANLLEYLAAEFHLEHGEGKVTPPKPVSPWTELNAQNEVIVMHDRE